MCSDFQVDDAVSGDETASWDRPLPARYWLISVTTCEARSARFVPHDELGVQFVTAVARGTVTAATAASSARTEKTKAAKLRREVLERSCIRGGDTATESGYGSYRRRAPRA